MRKFLSGAILIALIVSSFSLPSSGTVDTKFTFESKDKITRAGQTIEYILKGENLTDLYAYEAVIAFDPNMLELVESKAALDGFAVPPKIEGNKAYIAFTQIGRKDGVKGSQTLSTIIFKVKNPKSAEPELISVKAVDSGLNYETFLYGEADHMGILYQDGVLSEDKLSATARVTKEKLDSLFAGVRADRAGKKSIKLVINPVDGVIEYIQIIPVSALTSETNDREIILSTPLGSISIPNNILYNMGLDSESEVAVSIKSSPASSLHSEIRKLTGDRPVLDITFSCQEKTIPKLNGSIVVMVPYKPKAGEDVNAVIVYYINDQGKATVLINGMYSAETGMVTFKTGELFRFAVAYNKISFNDVPSNEWYHDAVSFLAARGITLGTGNNNYSPGAILTRAEFLVMLMRAYGIMPEENPQDNFLDGGNSYYTGYLAAAKTRGISKGIGNNRFGPNLEITRQEMFTLVYNALKTIDKLPTGLTGNKVESYSDAGEIAPWAAEAMKLLVETGTIVGSGNKLYPVNKSTRAEMAQVLYNLLSK